MKKIVSLMALCAVLLGAVMVVTGCGSKPEKGSVWQVTSDGEAKGMYFCFHSDGHLYTATKMTGSDGKEILVSQDGGTYSFDTKNITMLGQARPYTLKGETLTIESFVVMKKVSSPTEDQIKKTLNPAM